MLGHQAGSLAQCICVKKNTNKPSVKRIVYNERVVVIPSFISVIAAELVEAKLSQEKVGFIFVSIQEAPPGIHSRRTAAKLVLVSLSASWRQNNHVTSSGDQFP